MTQARGVFPVPARARAAPFPFPFPFPFSTGLQQIPEIPQILVACEVGGWVSEIHYCPGRRHEEPSILFYSFRPQDMNKSSGL